MRCGESFAPQSPNESEVYGFDFIDDLEFKENILSVVSWAIEILSGKDDDYLSRLSGEPTLDPESPRIVRQRVTGLQPGVRYLMTCIVLTDRGNTIELSAIAPGKAS